MTFEFKKPVLCVGGQDYHHISDGFRCLQITVASLKRYLRPLHNPEKRPRVIT